MKKYIVFLVLLWGYYSGFSQPAIGEFKSHLPYNSFHTVAVSENYVYAANRYSVMVLSKEDNTTSYWSKVEGLSDVGITKLAYDDSTNTLIIGYENGNIDLIVKNEKIRNIPDIKNKSITGSKSIRKIKIINKTAYLLCDFGVSLLNLKTQNFTDTWFTNIQDEKYAARDLLLYRDRLYLATPNGLFSIPQNHFAIADFSQWEKNAGLGDINIAILQVFSDIMLVAKEEGTETKEVLFSRDAISWEPTLWEHAYVADMKPIGNDKIVVFDFYNYNIYDDTLALCYSSPWSHIAAREGVVESEKIIWVADICFALGKIEVGGSSTVGYSCNGPETGSVGAITSHKGKVVMVPGSNAQWTKQYIQPSCNFYEYGEWHYLKPEFFAWNQEISDLANVIINPSDPDELYVASWGDGLFRIKNNEVVEWFTHRNSVIECDTYKMNMVSGLSFDTFGNLWLTNSNVANLVKVRKKDGSWTSFNLGSHVQPAGFGTIASSILVDQRNYKWIVIPRKSDNYKLAEIVVLDDKNTIDYKNDDRMVSISMREGSDGDATNEITAIVEDRDGYIWLGTDRGIKVIYTPGAVFDQTVYPQRILLQQLGYTQYLFEYEKITCIAVDGANRKWVGTSKAGVFLISADGTEELLHFTEENSPLNSNEIVTIAINHENGEVFIGTSAGLISYGGTATKGKEEYDKELKIFPNPVREDYHGDIAISGLMEDSFCKIADAAGNLVWQGYAFGGQLIWNGKDFHGNRPATGVYFIFASNQTGKEKKVGKILFIN